MKELETERLLLRRIREDDAEEMFDCITSSSAVARYVTWHAHTNISETVSFINFCMNDYKNLHCYRWGIELKETGSLVGMIDVVGYSEGEPEIGYVLGEKYWGQGYMTEACLRVLEYLLFDENFKTIYAEAHVDNIGSNRVLEKCGFHFIKSYERPQGQSKPEVVTVNAYRINRNHSEFLRKGRSSMKEFELKYGCNPNQKPSKIFMHDGSDLPIEILNGKPGYINFLDAFNSYQLVKEIKEATGMCAATSFKHVSPTSAAVGRKLPEKLKKACFVDDIEGLDDSPLACAYARARGTDRMSSFGDWIALSDVCDVTTAMLVKREVSDGIIAPGYEPEALEILKSKKKGNYNIVKIDADYKPDPIERKQVYGITFEQGRNEFKINSELLENVVTDNKNIPDDAKVDLIIALITLKYTQSNSVCYAVDGQAIGVGAGQQSRIHCTRLAGSKADIWHLRQHDKVLNLPFLDSLGRPDRDNVIDVYISDDDEDVLGDDVWQQYFKTRPEPLTREEKKEYLSKITGVALGSDAFFPFGDNIERARRSGVSYIAQPGGSIRDDNVIEAANKYGMAMVFTKMRLFHH